MKTRFTKYIKDSGKKINLSIGEITLSKILGEGGNGIVYCGEILDNSLALKFLLSDTKGKSLETKSNRFLAEYFNIVSISNTIGIVKYIDYDVFNFEDKEGQVSVPVILMKKYDSSLTKLQETNNQDEFIRLFDFLLDTVEKIHNEGIIHRDLKPENILVDKTDFVLADFGIASYNPEIFQIRAETNKKERIGNRLFSAPEQEDSGISASENMDIYAIGQIMQWYATGKTHRGTERQRITSVFEKLGIFDSIIEKCLSNNPEKRFQKISEIRDYKNRTREKDLFEYMYDFNRVLRSNFPKNDYRFIHSNNIKRIDKLFQSFKDNEKKFDKNLWWHDGSGNFEFELKKKGEGIWKFWDSEYSIKEIWIHYDNSVFNDFILVHYQPSKPFIIDGKEKYHSAIVDDKHHITFSEHQNGFAEIGDEVVDLSKDKVEFTEKQEEEGYFFIGTRFHCILRTKNDENVRNFIEQITFNEGKVDIEEFQKFQREVRKHKLPQIVMRL